ncbi:hypothetical protein [Sedimentisphaera salicampi]|uniref:hypothetical protein n=1 Tax=Sedimentisphaera salicampi TaxID=1941349 RepID=UPI000B9C6472|nr:hypothetical protein [Sedimentisphaera salicampi]OXU14699.1 hypothetical protein SMSP1_01579 [Sedimentisphaera salicampi]
MDLPESLTIDKILNTPGAAFRAVLQEENEKFRFYFIVNLDPQNQDRLLMLTATSRIESVRNKFPEEVLVLIKKSDFPNLERDSLINCEMARVKLKKQLRKSLLKAKENGKLLFLDPLPESLLLKVRSAIAKCKTIPPIDKKLAVAED